MKKLSLLSIPLLLVGMLFFLTSNFSYNDVGKTTVAPSQEKDLIHWMTLEEAVKAQAENPKKIIMDIYTDWCGPCKMLDKNTFHHPQVAEYINAHYYPVRFNAEGNDTITFKGKTYTNPGYDPARKGRRNSAHQLTRYFGVRGYPTIVFLDENADLLTPLTGYYQPKNLEIFLKLFATDDYKKIKTKEEWQKYQENFKGEFK